MSSISEKLQQQWRITIKSTDMSKNSNRAYPAEPKQHDFTTTAITVAHQLLQNGKPMEKIPRPKIKHVEYIEDTGLTTQFSSDEHNQVLKPLRMAKLLDLMAFLPKKSNILVL